MNSDQIIEKLGDEFYELKRMVAGGFCAYGIHERAIGSTAVEALDLLYTITKKNELSEG